jgi:acyl carrier protein
MGDQLSPSTTVGTGAAHLRECAAAAWEAVLGEGPPADDDNFFDCGGDSVHALVLIAELSAELDVAIPVTTLLRTPTFGGFVAALTELSS